MFRIAGNTSVRNSILPPQIISSPPVGSIGPTGPTGTTGIIGTAGITGSQGSISYVQIYLAMYPTGTAGGTMTANTWNVRPLNATGGGNLDGVYTSLAADTITFAPGTYAITGRAVSWGVARNQLRLRNTTSSSTIMNGIVVQAGTGVGAVGRSQTTAEVSAITTFAATAAVQLQHNCSTTVATNGMGSTGGFAGREREVYAAVSILKMQ